MELKDWLVLIGNVPFAIIVAFYLLYRLDASIQKLIGLEEGEHYTLTEIRDELRQLNGKRS